MAFLGDVVGNDLMPQAERLFANDTDRLAYTLTSLDEQRIFIVNDTRTFWTVVLGTWVEIDT